MEEDRTTEMVQEQEDSKGIVNLKEGENKMEELLTWGTLGTLVGATAAVLLITQYIKSLLPKIHTRLIALVLAVVILIAVTAVTGGQIEDYGLALLNAFVVASSAMGAYQVTFAEIDAKKKE